MGRRKKHFASQVIGKTFTFLTALTEMPGTKHGAKVECLCKCGKKTIVRVRNLLLGKRRSCGCYRFTRPENWQCSTCKKTLPFTKDFFHLKKGSVHGLTWTCRECVNKASTIYQRKLRSEAITHYSNGSLQCICCGEKTIEFLTLDHPNNDGRQERKKYKTNHQLFLALKKQNWPPSRLQVMCFNCNLGRALTTDGICPHKKTL